uniref:Uncharacterized protein n=1 Tax=Tanacetum cinerariifolium TaxID=118510 RepID=A0A699JX77_TANCI|nr:hypothetical protein [Tanacetum cinerariifolium]
MGYEKPSTKLTFYKAFFSPKWKFLIHTIVQCMSAKRTSWNEFSSFMASTAICLSTVTQQDDDVVDEGAASVAVDNVPTVVDEPSIPSPTPTTQPPPLQDLPSTSQVLPTLPPSPIDQPLSPQQPPQPLHNAEISMDLLHTLLETYTTLTRRVEHLEQDKDVVDVAKDVDGVEKTAEIEEHADVQGRQAESQPQIYQIDLEHADKVLSMQDDDIEPTELKEVMEVVTIAKLMTEVVTTASATITAIDTLITVAALTAAFSAARRRKRVLISDPKETATPSIIIHSEPKSKDKGK